METETTSHILCECVALAELRFHHLHKNFMEMSNYDEILLCNILYFVEVKDYWWNKEDRDAQ
jgi:hypothetical protein